MSFETFTCLITEPNSPEPPFWQNVIFNSPEHFWNFILVNCLELFKIGISTLS